MLYCTQSNICLCIGVYVAICIQLICYFTLLVSPPLIIKQPTDEVAEIFSFITLECKVQGYGHMNVEWRKLGYPLPNTAVVSNINFTNGICSILKIKNVVGYYDGMYCCVVSNVAGQTTSKYAKVSVKGKSDSFINYYIRNLCQQ